MNPRSSYPTASPFAALFLACAVHSSPAAEDAASSPAFFESKIRPLLVKHCTECHGEKKQKGELRLDLKAAAFKGGETGAAIVAGDSGKSPLLQRILSDESDEKMPPKGERLSREEIALLKTWIENGAVKNAPQGRAAEPGGDRASKDLD